MSDPDSTTLEDKTIKGFTKSKSLYCLKAPWLETKGALGKARRELSERKKSIASDSN